MAELNRRAPQRGFDPSKGATADPHEVRPPAGTFVLAYLRGEAIGCGAVKHQPDRVTDIKRMWSRDRRAARVSAGGCSSISSVRRGPWRRTAAHLETSDVLPEAIALYRSSGYVEVPPFNDEPFADHWFEKTLFDQSAP